MSVFFKFAASTEVSTVTFDGVHISVGDLKQAIVDQKRLGRGTDFQLIVTNSQTEEEYSSDSVLIPKNSSLVVKRIPVENGAPVKKFWDPNAPRTNVDPALVSTLIPPVSESVKAAAPAVAAFSGTDLTKLGGSEEDKIKSMMSQSTSQYDPSTFVRYRNQHLAAPAPRDHKCYRCFNLGHYAQQCPLVAADVKKATGIPRSFMMTVADPKTPGAMLAPDGTLAVAKLDYLTYTDKERGRMSALEQQRLLSTRPLLPATLQCTLCTQLMRDAVTSPCCGENFCDQCFRCALIESDSSQCPHCGQKDGSTDNIIPNRFVRKRVVKFQKEMDEWEASYAANGPLSFEPPPTTATAAGFVPADSCSAEAAGPIEAAVAVGSIRVKSSSLLMQPPADSGSLAAASPLQLGVDSLTAGSGSPRVNVPPPAHAIGSPSTAASVSDTAAASAGDGSDAASPAHVSDKAPAESASANNGDSKIVDAEKSAATTTVAVAGSIKTESSDTPSESSAHDSNTTANTDRTKQERSSPTGGDSQDRKTDNCVTNNNEINSDDTSQQQKCYSSTSASTALGNSPQQSSHASRTTVSAGNLCRLAVHHVGQGQSGPNALVSLC